MLISSNFHDYYDSVAASGVDKTIVYNRREKSTLLDRAQVRGYFGDIVYNFLNSQFSKHTHGSATVSQTVIGFCGNVYLYALRESQEKLSLLPVRDHLYGEQLYNTMAESTEFINRFWWNRGRLEDFKAIDGSATLEKFFLDSKIVSFTLAVRGVNVFELIQNPCLRPFEFYRIVDPYTAFQKIAGFISGVLGTPNNPIVEIGDVTRLEKHGFDKKFSFRKAPTKHIKGK